MAYTVEFERADGSFGQIWQTFSRRRDAVAFGEATVMEEYFWNKTPLDTSIYTDEQVVEMDRMFRDLMVVDFKVVKL